MTNNGRVKNRQGQSLQNRTRSSKKVLYAISSILVAMLYKFLAKMVKPSQAVQIFYQNKRPSKGLKRILFIHDNASAHKSQIVLSFLQPA